MKDLNLSNTDKSVLDQIPQIKSEVDSLIRKYKFREAQNVAMSLARVGNKYQNKEYLKSPYKRKGQLITRLQTAKTLLPGAGLLGIGASFPSKDGNGLCECI